MATESNMTKSDRSAETRSPVALPPVHVGRYTDPEFAALEDSHVWRKTWISAGHVSELPDRNTFKLFDRLGLSIIISRGKDDVVRAFHNVCRHRGARLVTEARRAPRLICPYHGWAYQTDGTLSAVPDASDFPCLNKAETGLVGVRCEIWRGFIYINLDDQAGPLEEFLAPIATQFDGFPLEKFVIKGVIHREVECNWKVAYDNFLEIYHVKLVHPQTIAPYLDTDSFSISLLPHGHARFKTSKRLTGAMFGKDTGERPTLSSVFENETVAVPFFPNGFTAIDPAAFGWQTFWPVDHRRSLMEILVMGWADNDDEDFWTSRQANMEMIASEDVRIFGGIQRNLEGGAIDQLLMSSQERALYWYQQEIDRLIGSALPPSLALAPVLTADPVSA